VLGSDTGAGPSGSHDEGGSVHWVHDNKLRKMVMEATENGECDWRGLMGWTGWIAFLCPSHTGAFMGTLIKAIDAESWPRHVDLPQVLILQIPSYPQHPRRSLPIPNSHLSSPPNPQPRVTLENANAAIDPYRPPRHHPHLSPRIPADRAPHQAEHWTHSYSKRWRRSICRHRDSTRRPQDVPGLDSRETRCVRQTPSTSRIRLRYRATCPTRRSPSNRSPKQTRFRQ
jgi:hypothetical protein